MAGHSKFKNIQHRKGAQDQKRAKIFTKLLKDISVAVKSGDVDPATNTKLRSALITARALNLPKERIEKALHKQAADEQQLQELYYECFAAGGVAIIVEVITDNRNRIAAEVRSACNRFGGSMGETNSVSFMFERLGFIHYQNVGQEEEQILMMALEAGAEDVQSDEQEHVIYSNLADFNQVLNKLAATYQDPVDAYLGWRAKNHCFVKDEAKIATVERLLEALEDNEDVRRVFHNMKISEA